MADLEIIKQIERILGMNLDVVRDITFISRGYSLNEQGQVTGLGLSGYGVESLKVHRIFPLLKELAWLRDLQITNNALEDISQIAALTNLTRLDLNDNQISNISPLAGLINLAGLELGSNKIRNISPLAGLINLEDLYLTGNKIRNIFSLSKLKNLRELYLGRNQVEDISPLKDLKKMERLYLWKNLISNLSPLREMKCLKVLTLQDNAIEELPPWITDFGLKIVWNDYVEDDYIQFENNPLRSPPLEIVRQGNEAIRNYFNQLKEQEEDYLFEAKVLIVGEPGAGKTSMAGKIENPACLLPGEEETTKGISVKQYYFPLQKEDFSAFKHPAKLENRKFRLNLWDFGGQEIYKATHRFFLSKRSLYALVADSRNEDTDFNYWLHIVEMFGGESPFLIVLNEKHQRKRNLDISAMQKRFTNISEVIDVDFAEADKTRLNKLERAIKYYVSQLPHIGSPVPAKWTVIREATEDDPRNTITFQDYMTICQNNGITRLADAMVLSQYFHDIGVFLHFQDDDLLKKTIFLKPNWATNAVYKILDHELLNRKNGRFDKEDAKIIWGDDEYELIRDELLRLMQKFFLVYEVERSGEYIVPERLPPAQPEYDWDEKNNLFLRYEYDFFMPKGIMSQLTVRMHRYISDHDRTWRRGVVLERERATAEIVESYDARTIKIRVAGINRRDFMTIITEQLDQINSQYEKMKIDKLIPCTCGECKKDGQPYFFKYKDLRRRLEKGRQEVECGKSYEMVNVRGLIDEVLNEDLHSYVKNAPSSEGNNRLLEKVERNKVFISYSHKDAAWLKRVQTHLKVLENLGIAVNLWDDNEIKSGMLWREEIEKALSAAKVAILLVSTDFLASDFILNDELPLLLKAAENDGATILPLILKPCLYAKHQKLAAFQAVNDPLHALSKLTEDEQDEILIALAERIAGLINESR